MHLIGPRIIYICRNFPCSLEGTNYSPLWPILYLLLIMLGFSHFVNFVNEIMKVIIIETVDSICRDSTDTQYMLIKNKFLKISKTANS